MHLDWNTAFYGPLSRHGKKAALTVYNLLLDNRRRRWKTAYFTYQLFKPKLNLLGYFDPGRRARYCEQRASMSVCPLAYLRNDAFKLYKIFTGSIARSASRRYLIYSEADFEVFCPAGATRCTDGVKFGTVSPPSVQRQGCRTPKTDIFTQI